MRSRLLKKLLGKNVRVVWNDEISTSLDGVLIDYDRQFVQVDREYLPISSIAAIYERFDKK